MKMVRQVLVLDAADVASESRFWAGVFDGVVVDDDPDFHCVLDAQQQWILGVQRSERHTPPVWPDGDPQQQMHLDLHVEDLAAAHAAVTTLGARLVQAAIDPSADEGFQVYLDPAGHPFCVGWGHPSDASIREHTAHIYATSARVGSARAAEAGRDSVTS